MGPMEREHSNATSHTATAIAEMDETATAALR